jgi:hypothetical protein
MAKEPVKVVNPLWAPCPTCGAKQREFCQVNGREVALSHPDRIALPKHRDNAVPNLEDLDPKRRARVENWKKQLGQIPDPEFARKAGVPTYWVALYRRAAGIPPYKRPSKKATQENAAKKAAKAAAGGAL